MADQSDRTVTKGRHGMTTRTPLEADPAEERAVDRLAHDMVARRKFLKMMGGAGAAGALSLLLAACGDDDSSSSGSSSTPATSSGTTTSAPAMGAPPASFGDGDLGIVNYALTLEHIEADFYAQALKSGIFKGTKYAKYAPTLTIIGKHEADHVVALMGVANKLGKAAPAPKTDFSAVFDMGPDAVAGLAANVENLGAAAYLGQAANIKSPEILAAALAIHTVEARHAAALNLVVGNGLTGGPGAGKPGAVPDRYFGILPDGPFGMGAPAADVLALATPFISG